MNQLTTEQAIANLDKALSQITATRETHAILLNSLELLSSKAIKLDSQESNKIENHDN